MRCNVYKYYFADCEALLTAVKKYLEASNKGDSSIMAPYFHKDAVIFWGGNEPDEHGHEIGGFFDFIDESGADTDKNPPFHIDILDITPTTAVTKVVEVWQGKTYTDYHTFVKTPEGWKITAKFSTHTGRITMSKVLLINGSPNEQGCTYTALKEVADTLEKNGVETEILYLGKKPIAGCIACGKCFGTGRCVFNDKVNEILDRLDEYDGIVLGSPVYYAGPTGQLCAFLDRLFFCSEPRMAGKLGAAVVSCRRGGASAAFDRLNKYFSICNMTTVGSQYWNQVHGFTPEDVRKDEEGLQTMRTLGQNMAWLLKNIKSGKTQGIAAPEYEERLRTNFI